MQLTHLLAPDYCCNCRKIGQILCQSCTDDIISEPFARCLGCLQPTHRTSLCQRCHDIADDAWVVGERRGALEELVNASKFDANRRGCARQAELLGETVPLLPREAMIVPIPTIPRHIRQRGYGHMELVAREFARQRGYRYAPLLERTGNTVQHGADRLTRQRQAARAFRLGRETPRDVPLLVLDDVYTTGATLRSAVALLRSVVAQPIYVAVTTRQLLD